MGRIKTLYIKRKTRELMELHGGLLTDDFESNKRIVSRLIDTPSAKMRNVIVGYATRLKRREGIERRARRAMAASASAWEPGEHQYRRRRRAGDSMSPELSGELQAL